MFDEGSLEALVEQLVAQGWDQGCLLPWRHDLFLAQANRTLTKEADRAAARAQPGADRLLVSEEKKQGEMMIVISQLCDIASPAEPMIEALPLVRWDEGRALPFANSARHFTVDEKRRLVADATRKLIFEKTLLADAQAEQLMSETRRRSFAAWCARRYSRVAWDNDFVDTVGSALSKAIEQEARTNPDAHAAIYSWRVLVQRRADTARLDAYFLVPFDEKDGAAAKVTDFVAAVSADAKRRLPKTCKQALAKRKDKKESATLQIYRIAATRAEPSNRVSLRALNTFIPFNLEHMTYRGDVIQGAEPHEEATA